jgi:uncharacterized coiled-coil DUF342 family protein
MTMQEREGLIARIRHLRRQAQTTARPDDHTDVTHDRLKTIEARIAHLERLLEGLQDSVHRESDRHEKQIAELQAQIQPGAMGAALAEDARNRGL